MRKQPFRVSTLIAALATLLSVALVQPAGAASTAVVDEGTANVECAAYFLVPSGPEPLSSCQWDMRALSSVFLKISRAD